MNRVAIVTVLVLVGVALGAATAAGQSTQAAGTPTPATADPGNASAANNSSGASLGASVSAFMQSNTERASQSVDQGMWSAAFNRSDGARKQQLADAHVGTLRERLDALAEQRRELLEAYRNGSISKIAFQARMSALGERYQALNQSVDDTKRAVGRENVNAPGLADLDRSLQRGATVTVADNRSPPVNVTIPGFDRGNGGPGDRTTGPPDNRTTGPPDHAQGNERGDSGNATGESPVDVNTTVTTTEADTPDLPDNTTTITIGRLAGPSDEQTPF